VRAFPDLLVRGPREARAADTRTAGREDFLRPVILAFLFVVGPSPSVREASFDKNEPREGLELRVQVPGKAAANDPGGLRIRP
jgi:hypothetical protein